MFNTHELEARFGKHTASIEGPNPNEAVHEQIRQLTVEYAARLDLLVPDTEGKDIAFLQLETTSMWFHKALAHGR